MGSVFDGQVTGQSRAPPATAEGRWSRRPREGPGQRPRPALSTPGPPAVPGQIPGGAAPARAGPAVPRPARRPPPATTETCGALRASGGQRSAGRPSRRAGAARPAHPWLPVRSGPVASQARGASPAQPPSAPQPRGHPAPLPAGPHREPLPPRVSRIEAAPVTRMFPLPVLCLHSGVSLPLASAQSAKALFCPLARSVCNPTVTLYESSRPGPGGDANNA